MRRLAPLLLLLPGCDPAPAVQATPAPPADFESLASWTFSEEQRTPPAPIAALHATKVEIRGFIYPPKNPRNLRSFLLTKDRGTCCYGQKAQWTHFIEVTVPEGVDPVQYTTEPLTVVGTLRVEPKFFGDAPDGLYFMDAEAHRR